MPGNAQRTRHPLHSDPLAASESRTMQSSRKQPHVTYPSRQRLRRIVAPLVLSISIAGSAGCASDDTPAQSTSPYAEDIKAASSHATTDFERNVLADGQITRAEYEEAVQKLVACAEGNGKTVITHDQSGLYSYEVPGGDPDDVMLTCGKGTTMIIEGLYSQMVQNPDREDLNVLLAACLVRSGLASADFSGEDFKHGMEESNQGSMAGNFPFDTNDTRFTKCLSNPSA
jgi:hypothetical protein